MPTTAEMHDLLVNARARITNPACWTRNVMARDADGDECRATILGDDGYTPNPNAVAYCAMGALIVSVTVANAAGVYSSELESAALRFLAPYCPHGTSITFVNDQLGHDAVLAVFDRAIAAHE